MNKNRWALASERRERERERVWHSLSLSLAECWADAGKQCRANSAFGTLALQLRRYISRLVMALGERASIEVQASTQEKWRCAPRGDLECTCVRLYSRRRVR
jgi:hypothetical protein